MAQAAALQPNILQQLNDARFKKLRSKQQARKLQPPSQPLPPNLNNPPGSDESQTPAIGAARRSPTLNLRSRSSQQKKAIPARGNLAGTQGSAASYKRILFENIRRILRVCLRYSWLWLVWTGGLTFIYTIIHFIGAEVMRSQLFDRVGTEWPEFIAHKKLSENEIQKASSALYWGEMVIILSGIAIFGFMIVLGLSFTIITVGILTCDKSIYSELFGSRFGFLATKGCEVTSLARIISQIF